MTHILVLAAAHSYRLEAFLAAAQKVGVTVVRGLDVPPAHVGPSPHTLGLDFRDPARALRQVRAFVQTQPLAAIIPVDDGAVLVAAHLAEALHLPHNHVAAAHATRDKWQMRQLCAAAHVPGPWFQAFPAATNPTTIAHQLEYPCVIKPTCLSGSRGVMRVDNPEALPPAWARLQRILAAVRSPTILVEGYLPGAEFALEGLLNHGALHTLALFDKPDPLEGPFFEETIYVTPSRWPVSTQTAIAACVAQAAQALGLREGAVHAEVRVNPSGVWANPSGVWVNPSGVWANPSGVWANPSGVWLLEIAGRSIGGLCGQTLRFAQTAEVTLEELIVRQAVGLPLPSLEREAQAGGVMMIPIPAAGILTAVQGVAAAQAVPLIEKVEITTRLNYPLVPLPEGDSYLGFIFARGPTPAAVEAALRTAHAQLVFEIEPLLPLAIS